MNKHEILHELWFTMSKKCLKERFDDEEVLLDFTIWLTSNEWDRTLHQGRSDNCLIKETSINIT